MSLKDRVSRLEKRHGPQKEPGALFVGFYDLSVDGWRAKDGEVLRQPGESDEELESRARRELSGPVFWQISNERVFSK